jgi:putative aldouronate transport system permease protein
LKPKNIKQGIGFNSIGTVFIAIFMAFCLAPLILVFIVSITDEAEIRQRGYTMTPQKISFEAYRLVVFGDPLVPSSYAITIFTTAAGTAVATLITGLAGYSLANRHVRYRNFFALFFFITMVFNPGLVPWYLMNRSLGLRNNILALIIPRLLFSPFNLFLVRNYMKNLPDSLMESARIDGADDATIAFRIYLPLSVPVLAAITLFYGLAYWNDWFNAIMLVDDVHLYPVQYLLMRLQSEIRMLEQLAQGATTEQPPAESFKMATAIVTIGPIVLLYPFLQRYFIQGLVIGSIKG